MYRTDKQFMRDPATASSRIYVGNLPETVVADNLEQKFKIHGRILGLVLQRGFGFIQFENDEQAQTAIDREHGSNFCGRKINVRRAFDPKKKPGNNQNSQQPPHNQQQQSPHKHPPHQNQQPPAQSPLNEKPPNQNDFERDAPPPPRPRPQPTPPHVPEPPMHKPPMDQPNKPPMQDRRNNKRKMRGPMPLPPPEGYRNNPMYYGPGFVPPPLIDAPERNDCEIIVVSKALTEYAEYIEQRLKALGLIVDLLFPNEDVPIGRVLANISSRGCLYAILIMPQNEEHRSLTLDILHGIPQEHRNMPIEDALTLITRNFDAYMRGEQTGSGAQNTGINSLSDRHPEAIQMLFNLLAENRQITTAQYDRLIKYLLQRRDLQSQHEVTEGGESTLEEPLSKQAELQSRIMSILNKSSEEPPKLEPTPTKPVAPTPLLNDPTVQKALDSLLTGEMFKSISAAM